MSDASVHTATDDELDPDEPRTPLWLPVLGLALFLLALGYALVTSDEQADGADAPPAAGDTAEGGDTKDNPAAE
jgi:hypothetical protein